MTFDPYRELGVPRNAGPAQVRQAYKDRVKVTHPDAGGSAEAFELTQRALAILENPQKRAEYDKTGKVADEKSPLQAGIDLIGAIVGQVLHDFLVSGFDPQKDPRAVDIVDMIRHKLQADIVNTENMIEVGEKARLIVQDFLDRFSGGPVGNPIQLIIKEMLRRNIMAREGMERDVAIRKQALQLLEGYHFRKQEIWE